MPDFIQKYNINILYVSLILLSYNIWITNCYYIDIILNKLYLLNYTSFIIIINIIGLSLFLINLTLEINIQFSLKYK
jgi:hypothetical protein